MTIHKDRFKVTYCNNTLTQGEWDSIFNKGGQGESEKETKPLTTVSSAETAGKDKKVGDTPNK